jgi:hypothetical protein
MCTEHQLLPVSKRKEEIAHHVSRSTPLCSPPTVSALGARRRLQEARQVGRVAMEQQDMARGLEISYVEC